MLETTACRKREKPMKRFLTLPAAIAAAGILAPALAHTGAGPAHDLAHGFLHPFGGLDHILAMVAVGLYAAQLGGRSLWLLPAAFVATMILGGLLGWAGVPLPMVEQGIGVSVVAMGIAIALGLRLPVVAATAPVALFALAHGHAHGGEATQLASFMSYAAGFVAATVALHAAGIAAGLGLDRLGALPAAVVKRAAGAAGALAGIVILLG
jgi:urease accessory protein